MKLKKKKPKTTFFVNKDEVDTRYPFNDLLEMTKNTGCKVIIRGFATLCGGGVIKLHG